MNDLEAFLDHNVEGYLFWDLRAMQRIIALPGEPGGGLGYPLLMTAFSGIELLGALLSHRPFDRKAGPAYFEDYWRNFLYPQSAEVAPEISVAYRLARNGIAHAFLLKGPLGVIKGQPQFHLAHSADGTFYIDASQLATDLIMSYNSSVQPCLTSPSARVNPALMGSRLKEMSATYDSQARAALPHSGVRGASGVGAPVGGTPQGASGPVPSSVSRS